ncbi:alpha-2-macroglobulin, partial [Sphingomonas solaris]
MRGGIGGTLFGLAVLAGAVAGTAAFGDAAPRVELATPGAGGGAIERYTLRFSEPMVPLGDPRATAPAAMACPVGGTGRWIDPQTWVHEFAAALTGGVTCTLALRPGLQSLRGAAVAGERRFTIDTGGPSARAILPGSGEIEEGQLFLVAANVAPDRASVAANAYCAVDGIGEKIAVDLLPPDVPARLVAGLGPNGYDLRNFLGEAGLPEARQGDATARATLLKTVTALKCRRPLPPGRDVALVWG